MITVPVYCTAHFPAMPRGPQAAFEGRTCHAELADHVHQPIPCANGHDERHHAFAPPKSVAVYVLGQRRRVKVPV